MVTGQEDCLTINVYTPTLEQDNLPVIVWIHDGGFFLGNSSYANRPPDLILDEDVIFVSFNYRLGVFGFFSTEDLAAPGNYAFKDQVLALKWVQDNIQHFGGDPKAVTIFGESAGAASVSYLLQSDLSKGLFRGAIMNSGVSTCLWSLDRRAKVTSRLLGTVLKVDTSDTSKMVEQLRQFDHVKTEIAAIAAESHVSIYY
nr:unnamed protein product [Callosobruchus chinensis]